MLIIDQKFDFFLLSTTFLLPVLNNVIFFIIVLLLILIIQKPFHYADMLKKHLLFLVLKTNVLLNIFAETVMHLI